MKEEASGAPIRAVVFDFGQVLVRYDPVYICEAFVPHEDAVIIAEELCARKYWDGLDAGTISDEEVIASSIKNLPERYADVIAKTFYNWIYRLPEIPGMRELVHEIKAKYGLPVYLLSNISRYFAAHAGEFPVLAEMDGWVFSAVCGHIKPEAGIFRHLTEKFSLDPAGTLFVDDNAANIEGARACGLQTYHFDGNADALRAFLKEKLTPAR